MKFRFLFIVLVMTLFGLSLPTSLYAQQPDDPTATDGEDDTPGIVVTPGDTVTPGITVTPADNDNPFEPFDLPDSYPGLSQQTFQGPGGVLRANRSIFDDPRNASILNARDLQEIAPIDIGQALELTPGVTIQRTGRGQSSPFIRGLTGQQVLILVDGIRMNSATFRAGPNQYLNQIDPNMVERIEVVRGPGSVQWGSDAIGGVINIVTKGPSFSGYNFLTGSTVQRFTSADSGYIGRVSAEGWVGATGFYGGAGYGNFNNLDRGGGLGRQPATSFNQFSGDIKLNHVISDNAEITVALQHFEQNDVFRTDRFLKGDERKFDPQARDLGYVRFNAYDLGKNWDYLSITASYSQQQEDQIRHNDNLGNFTTESQRLFTNKQVGLNILSGTDLGCFGYLTYGADWYHEDIDSSRTDFDFTTNPATVTAKDGPYPDDAYYSRVGAFVEWDVDITDRLNVISGLRYSYIWAGATVTAGNATGPISPEYDDLTGSIGMVYKLNDCYHLVGSVARGFRAPNLDDLTANSSNIFAGTQIPNPNLNPEHSWNYEIGLKANTERFHAQAFVYWMDIRDHILRIPSGNLNQNFTLTLENRNSMLNGVEFSAEALLACGWSTYGSFSYNYGQDISVNEPLSRVNPMQGILGLRWRDETSQNWFDSYLWMVDKQDRLSARDLKDVVRIPAGGTPGYTTLNFRYGRMISERQRITVNLTNVTDKLYRVHGSGSDGAGIGAMVGYELLR